MSISKELLDSSEERRRNPLRGRVWVRSKVASQLWRQMDAGERKLWEDKAEEEKSSYDEVPGLPVSTCRRGREELKGRKVDEDEDELLGVCGEGGEGCRDLAISRGGIEDDRRNGSLGYDGALQPAMYPSYVFAGWGGGNQFGAYTLPPTDVRHYPALADLGDGSAQCHEVVRYPDKHRQVYQGLPTEQAAATRPESQRETHVAGYNLVQSNAFLRQGCMWLHVLPKT
ncbi:hypothetical protein CPC08DRAFT_789525, partial [Agrocybe pediades]